MKRRSFVQNVAAASALSIVPAEFYAFFNKDTHLYAHPELLTILDDPHTVKEIGQAYLTKHPKDQSKQSLLASIDQKLGFTRIGDLKTSISKQVQADFAFGHTIQLNGWILSQTEAQQCALYSLTYA